MKWFLSDMCLDMRTSRLNKATKTDTHCAGHQCRASADIVLREASPATHVFTLFSTGLFHSDVFFLYFSIFERSSQEERSRGHSLTGFPGYPGCPGWPGTPSWPGNPRGPTTPTWPIWPMSPFFPSAPLKPTSPGSPLWWCQRDERKISGCNRRKVKLRCIYNNILNWVVREKRIDWLFPKHCPGKSFKDCFVVKPWSLAHLSEGKRCGIPFRDVKSQDKNQVSHSLYVLM